ncbi:MAG: hypothetical protein HY329_17325 [Chloroflexi bacterium]|nr:hypothetical protein [Chloroflexota bacterium]
MQRLLRLSGAGLIAVVTLALLTGSARGSYDHLSHTPVAAASLPANLPTLSAPNCAQTVVVPLLRSLSGYFYVFGVGSPGQLLVTWDTLERAAVEIDLYDGLPFESLEIPNPAFRTPPSGAKMFTSDRQPRVILGPTGIAPGVYTIYLFSQHDRSLQNTRMSLALVDGTCGAPAVPSVTLTPTLPPPPPTTTPVPVNPTATPPSPSVNPRPVTTAPTNGSDGVDLSVTPGLFAAASCRTRSAGEVYDWRLCAVVDNQSPRAGTDVVLTARFDLAEKGLAPDLAGAAVISDYAITVDWLLSPRPLRCELLTEGRGIARCIRNTGSTPAGQSVTVAATTITPDGQDLGVTVTFATTP